MSRDALPDGNEKECACVYVVGPVTGAWSAGCGVAGRGGAEDSGGAWV